MTQNVFVFIGLRYYDNLEKYSKYFQEHCDEVHLILFKHQKWDCDSVYEYYKSNTLFKEKTIARYESKKSSLFHRIFNYFYRWALTLFFLIKIRIGSRGKKFFVVTDRYAIPVTVVLRKLGIIDNLINLIYDFYDHIDKESSLESKYKLHEYYIIKLVVFLDRLACNVSDVLWVSGRRLYEMKDKQFPEKCVYFPLGIDEYDFEDNKAPSNEIMYMGGIYHEKGIELLIRTYERICKEIPEYKIHIIGTGDKEYIDELKTSYNLENNHNVIFHDVVTDNTKIIGIAKNCFLGYAIYIYKENVSASIEYVEPGKIKTYLSYRIPVVSSNIKFGLNDEFFENEVLIISKVDEDDFVKKVVTYHKHFNMSKNKILSKIRQLQGKYSYYSISKNVHESTMKITVEKS